MNDSPNTPWPAFMEDARSDLPEHFDWGALASLRARALAPVINAPSGHHGASSYDATASRTVSPVVERELRPHIEPASAPDQAAIVATDALDQMPETDAAHGDDASMLTGSPAPERSTVVGQEPLALAKTYHAPLPLPRDGILRLRFSDVGEPSEPGEHRSRFGLVEITRNDLAVWKAFPDAIFTVIQPSPYSNATISRLGTFEV